MFVQAKDVRFWLQLRIVRIGRLQCSIGFISSQVSRLESNMFVYGIELRIPMT